MVALNNIFRDLDSPPALNTNPGSVYSDSVRNYNMVLGGEVATSGRMWAAWVSGGDNGAAYIVVATSEDHGKTWGHPRLVIDPPDHASGLRVAILVGNLWLDPKGRLWLFFSQGFEHFDGRAGNWCIRCDNPDSKNPEWTKPQYIGFGMSLNKPICLKNGDWLLPVSLWTRSWINSAVRMVCNEPFPELDPFRMSNVFASSDFGESWELRGGAATPNPMFDEAVIVEREDASIWMTTRSREGIWEFVSNDQGASWSEPTKSGIAHVSSRHAIRRLKTGELVLVKHGVCVGRATARRINLTAFISTDEGETWKGGLKIEDRTRFKSSYPDIFEDNEGFIRVMYDYGRSYPSEIMMAKFKVADILVGEIISFGSELKMLVSRALGPR